MLWMLLILIFPLELVQMLFRVKIICYKFPLQLTSPSRQVCIDRDSDLPVNLAGVADIARQFMSAENYKATVSVSSVRCVVHFLLSHCVVARYFINERAYACLHAGILELHWLDVYVSTFACLQSYDCQLSPGFCDSRVIHCVHTYDRAP